METVELLPQAPQELLAAIRSMTAPGALADLAAAYLDIRPEEKQEILETTDVVARMEKVSQLLAHRLEVLRLSAEIGKQTKAKLDERQREFLLREQMAAIQKQLGEGDDGKAQEIADLAQAITNAEMPKEAEEQARKELRRLERMPEAAAEYGMVRSYLDWLIELPWKLPERPPIDIAEARRILDEDHYGLDKIKRRIIEYLAVRKLAPQGKAPILCFIGPPGVGKTSLGQSIARAMQRKFVRVSLGGVHDEAEIRGHRRTYIGALPGNIIQAIRKAGERDCVMMLDEIDKLGHGIQGDPASALLEVLDPEQNNTFRDNYLGGAVRSVAGGVHHHRQHAGHHPRTAARPDGDHHPHRLHRAREARDRAALFGAPAARGERAATDRSSSPTTRLRASSTATPARPACATSSGRSARFLRNVAVRIAEGQSGPIKIDEDDLAAILGPPLFEGELAMRTGMPGVATGLAWTPVGGDILFIEATRTPGNGRLILTGQLGDVMKESAQAALSIVKNRAAELGIAAKAFEKTDIHIHVPAGAMPKDGPSAGVAMFMALPR